MKGTVGLDDFTPWDGLAAIVVSAALAVAIVAGTVGLAAISGREPVVLPWLVAVESWVGAYIIVRLGTHRRLWGAVRGNNGGYNHA